MKSFTDFQEKIALAQEQMMQEIKSIAEAHQLTNAQTILAAIDVINELGIEELGLMNDQEEEKKKELELKSILANIWEE